jgi:fumarylacetoacetate (FAA) hydrolase
VKLASLRGGRDGELVVVSRDLTRAAPVGDIAPTLQYALDRWRGLEVALAARYAALNAHALADAFPFDERAAAAPLPRAYQWVDGSAYVNHVELVRRARGAAMPASFWTEPLVYQGGSDGFIAPHDPIPVADLAWGADFEGEVAVVTDDVAAGTTREAAGIHIRLVMLANDVSLRGLVPAELDKGFGFFQSKPASSFSPVAVTPDELGAAWDGGRVHLRLRVSLEGELFGQPHAGTDMVFDFRDLVAHASRTRTLCAGTIIGSGTVSNRQDPARCRVGEGGVGFACIAELRSMERLRDGRPSTPFLRYGDRVRIEMLDPNGNSIFGAIDQEVVPV